MPERSSNRPEWLRDILSSGHVFKLVTFLYFLPLFGCAYALIKVISDDPQTFKDFGVLVAVVCGFFGGLLAYVTLQKLGADDPIDTRRQRILLADRCFASWCVPKRVDRAIPPRHDDTAHWGIQFYGDCRDDAVGFDVPFLDIRY